MHKIDGEGATTDNRFTEGNPSTGTLATTVTADWLNAVQEEIINVLVAAGITPSKVLNNQLAAAIQSLISGGGVAVNAAGVTVADAGEYFSADNVEAALQQLAEKVYSGLLNSYQIVREVRELNSGGPAFQMTQWDREALVTVTHPSACTYQVRTNSAVPMPNGTAITLVQGGAGKVTITAESGVTLLAPASFQKATMEQHATVVLVKVAENTWRLGGMLGAA